MTLPRRFVSLLLLCCFAVSVVPHPSIAISTATTRMVQDDPDEDEGLSFRLSERSSQTDQPEVPRVTKPAPAMSLSNAETEAVLKRLPPITAGTSDETDFAWRKQSLPPPRTGVTVMHPFPAANEIAAPGPTTAGTLEIVRYSPEGDVPIASNLSITFSQPMIAVSSQEEAAQYVPVKLSPEPAGKWRWIGTRTLLFEPAGHFPMATQYSVSVPSGTKSANGGTLNTAKNWTFTTPPPTVKTTYPDAETPHALDAQMFVELDQRIDPAAVLKTIRVTAGTTQLPVRLATSEEIESHYNVKGLAQNAQKDRWLAFRATGANGDTRFALPSNSQITVTMGPGTPSLEGPRTTATKHEFRFSTFGPLDITGTLCGHNNQCNPHQDWRIEFNNDLDAKAFKESQVLIEPASDELKPSVRGRNLIISGYKKPDTIFRITVDESIRDVFGQTLGKDETHEFKVGPVGPFISLAGGAFVVLDPLGPRKLSLYTTNYQTVKISLYAVEPSDWVRFQVYRQLYYRGTNDAVGKKAILPGRLVYSKQIELKSSPNQMLETDIDLAPAFKDGFGQAIVAVETITPANDRYHNPLLSWVQSTQIGLDAFVDNKQLIGWANSLVDGAPLTDVKMQILPSDVSATTGTDGLAHLSLKPVSDSAMSVLVARRGNDVAILPENPHTWWRETGEWHHKPRTDELRWYVFDDRKLYRPGEEVHIKGWIRRIGTGNDGDVGPLNGAVKTLNYVIKDGLDNEVSKGELNLNAFGGFDVAFKLPPEMNLGIATVKFETGSTMKAFDHENFEHSFQVQEFRRPEFEVIAKNETEGPLFVGGHADVSVTANYFAGGGLANTEVEWSVESTPTNFTPPNRNDYTFGKWIPWWISDSEHDDGNSEDFTGQTDASGKHRLRIDFDSVNPPRPSLLTAEASVQDVNRQTWTATTTLLVHPANLYVGLRSEKTFVQQGEPLVVQSIVTDLDGKAIANREVKMRAVFLNWKQVEGEWTEVEEDPQDCVVQSTNDAVRCTFTSKKGGRYRLVATISDERGRSNQSELTLWVSGGQRLPRQGVEEAKVELIPDRKEYKAGETAQILVQSPFYPAEAAMTLRRSGIARVVRFRMDGPTYTLRLPIEEAWTPNVHVQVDLVGAEKHAGDQAAAERRLPVFASGEINLSIPPFSRRLNVVAAPREKTLEPAAKTVIDVEVKDALGNRVGNSEVAVIVVDESVLALTDYNLSDPLGVFYSEREADTNDYHSRSHILISEVGVTEFDGSRLRGLTETVQVSAAMSTTVHSLYTLSLPNRGRFNNLMLDGVDSTDTKQIALRQNFNALATFAPSVRTDADGRAHVEVKLPDNLTRYRVMAVAVAGGKQFGTGESAITARLPLMARPSAPRFLNFGDRFELPIVLQNQTDAPMAVDVAVRATNASLVRTVNDSAAQSTTAGRRVTVPANDRVEVRIPAAAIKAGVARFQIGAVSGRWSDAAEVELPVWTPATTEAFSTYGEVDEGAINQPVKAPKNVFPQFGGLQIETSSTQLQQLTDAVIYLTSYPYECSEQLASRIITIAALRDVLTAFKTKDLPSPQAMEAAVERDLKRLQGMQNEDGGFGFWQRGNESWPYLGLHVAHALARAKQKKFDVPSEMFEKSQKYLSEIESHVPSYYTVDAKRAIVAYALYVRAQMSDRDADRARKLIADAGVDKLSLESLGWLLSVLSNDANSGSEVAAIHRVLNNRVTETAGAAHFISSYNDSDYLLLNSNRRADGVILDALIMDQPASDLIPKIVRGLLAHRTRGRWENTQENVFILLALDRYFNTFEKVTPNFVARAWLGERFAGEQEFRGRSTDRQQVNVPMRYLARQTGAPNLVIDKNGAGRLYYRISMNYAPSDLDLKPADYGFTVERSYEAVDHPEDVSRDAQGVWHIKAGARVRVRLTMVAPARRYHVALVDPLPAGFEALNPTLATTGSIPRDLKQTGVVEVGGRSYGYGWWWWRPEWFEHQNLRDERTEAFASLLWEGVYKYSYVARATTPGDFVVPPAKAEEMYHPETFGRGQTDRVRIE